MDLRFRGFAADGFPFGLALLRKIGSALLERAVALARAGGFARRRALVRFVRGPNDWPGRPALAYAISSGPERG